MFSKFGEMKRFNFLHPMVFGLIIMAVFSCTKQGDGLNDMSHLGSGKLDFSRKIKIDTIKISQLRNLSYNLVHDDLTFFRRSNVLIPVNGDENYNKKDEIEKISLQTSIVDKENLNDVFKFIDESKKVLAITLLEDNSLNYDGLILYYSDVNGNLRLESYRKVDNVNVFEIIPFPANQVSGFTLNNLLFLARNSFPKRNIITYGIRKIGDIKPNNPIDNISMLDFAVKNKLLKNAERYRELINQTSEYENQGKAAPGCAVAVHHCMNGDRSQICHPFAGGCRDRQNCPKDEVEFTLLAENMDIEHQNFISNLVDQELYDFRDWLIGTPKGEFYTGAYYELSAAFKESLSIDLLLEVVSASSEMKKFVEALVTVDANYVLEPATFDMFIGIIEHSARNSQSSEYKAIIAYLVEEFHMYESKDAATIVNLLMGN